MGIAVNRDGKICMWGSIRRLPRDNFKLFTNLKFLNSVPKPFKGLDKIEIKSVSCNGYAMAFVGANGKLYTCGDDVAERSGVLGLGEIYYQYIPTMVEKLSDQEITQVSLGRFHGSALNSKGNIFAWGIGYKIRNRHNIPVPLNNKIIAKQILSACGALVIISGIYSNSHR